MGAKKACRMRASLYVEHDCPTSSCISGPISLYIAYPCLFYSLMSLALLGSPAMVHMAVE
ncbi:hypothetical protein T440DRAFT_470554 [Plenodomus tracheiphilus IPT5]|uniref:Uncharacterized protein n=1 Tax=Plenodomus tracheiphilus IPT5 TaxID=1408161 RepID=A0A6A7AYR4_9PLEO|nr:hypothetical protein T440DRAFT_470554 [Plenodomus tracheiphilus IPT5]